MATHLDDLASHYDPDLLLPIDGVLYRIPAPSIGEADRLRPKLWGAEARVFGPDEEWAECIKILGTAYAEMVAHEIPAPYVGHAGRTALIYFCSGPQGGELARAHWQFIHITERINVPKLMELLGEEAERIRNEDAAREAINAKATADGR
ncbi:hypothetical protein [Gordonia sp. OPL2]|uniref:DUF7426 family protein n=1 Tax=Gordonia sp. OPL2 TaxID=2486274 RepID=UPI0016562B6B|nr:hypothetical protein [Gordonia sp. OPL2]ROZ89014.1 hypothetical protein EEB19_20105 [Gordonia sp. OPL2]